MSVKQLAKLCGYLNSLSLAIGPVIRLFTRNLYATIEARSSWNDIVVAPIGVQQELQFWHENLHNFNGYPISRTFSASAVMYSDASDTGYGAYVVAVGDNYCQW